MLLCVDIGNTNIKLGLFRRRSNAFSLADFYGS